MTSKAEWLALAERCEKETGVDREIDCLIAVAVNDVPAGYMRHDAFSWTCPQPPFMPLAYSPAYFTYSLDAITALIERELPEMRWLCRPDKEGGFGTLYAAPEAIEQGSLKTWETIKQESLKEWPCWAYADTPALALCAAFCRAMAEKVTA